MNLSAVMKKIDKLEYKLLNKRYFNDKVYALLYHSVAPEKHYLLENMGDKIHLGIERFEEQIEYLVSRYSIVSLEEYIEGKVNGESLIITFDDGYKDNLIYAYPILKKHNVPFAICINSNFINNKDMFWLSKFNVLRKHGLLDAFKQYYAIEDISIAANNMMLENFTNEFLIENGIDLQRILKECNLYLDDDDIFTMDKNLLTILPHTHRHYKTTNLPHAERRSELEKSIDYCKKKFPEYYKPVFSFPFGSPGVTYDNVDTGILQEKKIKHHMSACNGINSLADLNGEIKRKSVSIGQVLDDFKYFIESPQMTTHKIRELRDFVR
jgi:peptidoglycan/xylan/chitin deacetylase (PgdA/CDA1 family)